MSNGNHGSGDGPWRPGGGEHGADGHADEEEHGAEESLEKGGKTAAELAEMVGKIQSGDASGALEKGLGAVGEGLGLAASLVDDEEAAEALETAETVLGAVGTAYKAVEGLLGHGGGHGSGHSASSGASHGERSARSALGGDHGAGSHAHDGPIPAHEVFGEEGVHFHLEVSGLSIRWQVVGASVAEALNEPFMAVVEARMEDGYADERELLGRAFTLTIERGASSQRTLRGVVNGARVEERARGHACHLELVPSLWLLGLGVDSRIFQEKTVPELVAELVQAELGDACRVDSEGLSETYETHEYLVQYQESTLAFISRLLEDEGIAFAIDCDADERETIVLTDAMSNLPFAREHEGGRLSYRDEQGMEDGFHEEHASDLQHTEQLGPAAITVAGHDWTHPRLAVQASRRGPSRVDPPREVYDHTRAVALTRFSDRQYNHHSADRASLLRYELVAQENERWTLRARVVTARPGTVVRLEGSPHDGSYLIVRADSSGEAQDNAAGRWLNHLIVQPLDVPYRPPHRTPRPVIAGPETATVVGPAGEEIHTDEHGRVKVHFHWDRLEAPDSERSSCWMRCSQSWAGPGFGTFFVPRIGMEVVVSFLGGNPDRPLVTGCVYNGENLARFAEGLPENKTQSYIRTKSSLNSEGFNELRFEDKAGGEFIYTHAQRDYNEVVEHCHSTHVKVDQSNTVDHNHKETVGNDQTLYVKKHRTKTIDRSETTTVGEDRNELVQGSEFITIDHHRRREVKKNDNLVVGNHRTTRVGAKYTITSTQQYKVVQAGETSLRLDRLVDIHTPGRILFDSAGTVRWKAESGSLTTSVESKWELTAGDELAVEVGGKATKLSMKSAGKVQLEAEAEIHLSCGKESFIKLTPSGIEIQGPSVKINASTGVTEIDAASQVRIKC